MVPDAARALLLIADRPGVPGARALSRMHQAGTHLRLRRGVYVDVAVWRSLTKEERLLLRMLALVATSSSRPVFSHWSAALLHGLPTSRRAADRVDVVLDAHRNRAIAGARAHLLPLEQSEVVEIDGMLCTSLLRTTVDVAADSSFEEAVVLADVTLQRIDGDGRAALGAAADLSGRRRGTDRMRRVFAFADPLSGSPGESISHVRIHRLGFVRPELQVRIVTDEVEDYGDFGWEEVLGLGDFGWEEVLGLGEFDGEMKYRDDRYRRGGEVEDVVIREKNRENRMRRQRPRFARWDWSDLIAGRLERILRETGIPKRRKDDDRDAAA